MASNLELQCVTFGFERFAGHVALVGGFSGHGWGDCIRETATSVSEQYAGCKNIGGSVGIPAWRVQMLHGDGGGNSPDCTLLNN